jgi:hypothetical protein
MRALSRAFPRARERWPRRSPGPVRAQQFPHTFTGHMTLVGFNYWGAIRSMVGAVAPLH